MPFNPNAKLSGLPDPPPFMHMNKNPTGFGGMLGNFQPQSPTAGATLNSTQFKPAQYEGIAAAGPTLQDVGVQSDPIWLQILKEQQKQNQLLSQQFQGGLQAGPRNEALMLAQQLEDQARRSAPTSGAYFFLGGL